jgi:transposase-like protein
MPHSTLMLWLKKAGWRKPELPAAVISEDPAVLRAQIRELQRQLKRSELEKDILKKATAYFASLKTSGSSSSIDDEESST